MPKEEEVPDEAREKYGWIDGTSITFNEILVGAYRCVPELKSNTGAGMVAVDVTE